MMPLTDKNTPGEGESWEELAEHALTHDDMRVHWHLASDLGGGLAMAARVRTTPALKVSPANPLGLRTVPCTGTVIAGGRHAGRCENHARRFGWSPGA